MKKYIAVFVAMGLLIASAAAQTINNVEVPLGNQVCLMTLPQAIDICVETTTNTPHIVTVHYVKEGHHLAIANQLFFNVSDMPCQVDPTEPEDFGSMVYWGHKYSHVWCFANNQTVEINDLNRVEATGLTERSPYGKVWQLNVGESVAFVFNKNNVLLGWVKNPPANRKWTKNTFVTICHGVE